MAELDPQAKAVLERVDESVLPSTPGLSVESGRTSLEEFFTTEEIEPVGTISEFSVPGPASDIPLRVYVPDSDGPHPALLYYHGGGWVRGSLDTHDNVCRTLCNSADCIVVSVDYRRAPESPFPAAVEDAYAAAKWVMHHGAEIGVDTDHIAVGGDSAGGQLTASVTLLARDEGAGFIGGSGNPDTGLELDHQVLIYPAVASPLVHTFDSYEENGHGYFLEHESMQWYYDQYLSHFTDARNEYAAPLLADDFTELPSATVLTCGFDPLHDEGVAYADRLETAGVSVMHREYERQIHGFINLIDDIDAASDALAAIASDLRDSFASR
ncbi:alpha/beta hydrolase [Haladaptatus sp. CMAA 1911]|uniref:alpha/beta hydrolase n=1 Tax=unclassified Haladaptatus TaxID=2622732 RepID=UPI00375506F1